MRGRTSDITPTSSWTTSRQLKPHHDMIWFQGSLILKCWMWTVAGKLCGVPVCNNILTVFQTWDNQGGQHHCSTLSFSRSTNCIELKYNKRKYVDNSLTVKVNNKDEERVGFTEEWKHRVKRGEKDHGQDTDEDMVIRHNDDIRSKRDLLASYFILSFNKKVKIKFQKNCLFHCDSSPKLPPGQRGQR